MLHTASISQILKVWSHLDDAYYGKASHGTTAEIYAYELMPCSPFLDEAATGPIKLVDEWRRDRCHNAQEALTEILRQFCDYRKCDVRINPGRNYDGLTLQEWMDTPGLFDHRVHIWVIKDLT